MEQRVIKFRGRRIDTGEWVYGYYFTNGAQHGIIRGDSFPSAWVEVQQKTVGEFVGLYDKNGKEIYEGDIIKSPFTGENVPVVYDQLFCQFTFGGAEFGVEVKASQIEVLGNIYENQNLLP